MMWYWVISAAWGASPVTVEDCVARAWAQSATVLRAQADLDAAAGRALSARGAFDPTLGSTPAWSASRSRGAFQGFPYESSSTNWDLNASLGGLTRFGTQYGVSVGIDREFSKFTTDFGLGETESEQDAYNGSLGLSLRQPILEGGGARYPMRFVRAAEAAVARAEIARDGAAREVEAAVVKAYWAWAQAEAFASIAADSEQAAAESLRVGRLRGEAGTIAPIELVRLEASEVQARNDRVSAERAAERALRSLDRRVGGGLAADATPGSEPARPLPGDLDVEDARARALAASPDLLALRVLREEQSSAVRDARHALLPGLDATAATGVGTREESLGDALTGLAGDAAFPYVRLGATVSVPLGNRAARGELAVQEATLWSLDLQVAELERALAASVADALAARDAAAERITLTEAQARLQRALLDAEEARIAAGGAIEQDLLTVRAAYAAARADEFRARADLAVAQAEIDRLIGAHPTH